MTATYAQCTGDTGTCPVGECGDCALRDCPHADPMHYHHDGCPACASAGVNKLIDD